MRYENWDVLLFPSGRDARVPLKEFKVHCHVVPDNDFTHNRGSFGLPAMTCFIPSLEPGANFHISIHCWGVPQVSQYTLNYSSHPELVKFEARIVIDGRQVASTSFEPFGEWPHLIANTCEMTKQGELEPLKFPSFRRELLYQNHWNPGDDIGRIKIIISEGFPRDSPSNPTERVKNVVAFSFQHAPLDILETNGIAWPNPQMWQRPQSNPAVPVPTYYPDDGADTHCHSPRRKSFVSRNLESSSGQMSSISAALSGTNTSLPHSVSTFTKDCSSSGAGFVDTFSEVAYQEWVSSLGLQQQQHVVEPTTIWPGTAVRNSSKQSTSTDTSMANLPDFLAPVLTQNLDSDPMAISGPSLDEENHWGNLKVPTNTPTALTGDRIPSFGPFHYDIPNLAISGELANSLTHSLLNQPHPCPGTLQSTQPHQIPLPASEVRSRKENRHRNNSSFTHSPSSNASPSLEVQIRKFSQTSNAFGVIGNRTDSSSSGPTSTRRASAGEFGTEITNQATPNQTYAGVAASGHPPGSGSEKSAKRNRNFTPASAKAIDEEDEPRRISPRFRNATSVPKNIHGQSQEADEQKHGS